MMMTMFVLFTIGQVKAGPLDAFRANRAAIRADIEFTYTIGPIDPALLRDSLWGPNHPEPRAIREQTVLCRWESDGVAEHLISRPPDDVENPIPGMKPGQLTSYQFPFEMVFDGQTATYHPMAGFGESAIHVAVTDRPAYIRRGPFNWLWPEPFPLGLIGDACRGMEPTYTTMTRDGHPTEVAIYHAESRTGCLQVEIYYDPSIGYLPRYIRYVAYGTLPETIGQAACLELYLLSARPCAAGGFVPTEYYDVHFSTNRFPKRYDPAEIETISQLADGRGSLAHFVVTKFEERKTPVRLDHLEGMTSIAGPGGIVPLRSTPRTLSLGEVKSRLGRMLTEPIKLHLPALDSAELHKFDRPARRSWTPFILGTLAALVLVGVLFVRWRRAGSAAALALIALMPGCGRPEVQAPSIHLSGRFAEDRVVYDSKAAWVPTTLLLKNDGNVPLTIREIGAGCSCRRVEQSVFPASLVPGGSIGVPVEIHDKRPYEAQNIVFTAVTEHGSINVPASLLAMPEHHFNPETVALPNLEESEEGTFELVHRAVFKPASPVPKARLDVPDGIEVARGESRSGVVAAMPEYRYEDTTYRFTVKDRDMGLHRSVIALRAADQSALLEVPVVWKRVEYLTPAPDRVTLGLRPIRVFLRCADEDVELSRIRSLPEGIKAVISSPREVTIRLAEGAADVIGGMVEVETTAEGRPPLRIPVVRYARDIQPRARGAERGGYAAGGRELSPMRTSADQGAAADRGP